jgi:Flp pilus assembly protein TadD
VFRRGAALFVLFVCAAGGHPAFALPENPSLAEAERLMARKDYRRAETLLRAVIAADARDPRAHGNLALALMAQGKSQEAVDEGRLAAAFAPDTAEARYIFGLALSAAGRPVEAARELARAVSMKPDSAPAVLALAKAYAAAEDERTAPTFEKYVAMRPNDAAARRELSEFLWRLQRDDEGNQAMDEAVRALPADPSLRVAYGRSLAQQAKYADAAKQLESARELGVSDSTTLGLLAASYAQSGEPAKARSVLAAACELHPGDATLRHDLGRLWLAEGRGADALPSLEEAARLKPRSAEIRLDLGRAQEATGQLEAAEASYREALRLAPVLPGPHYALGRLLVKTGRRPDGEAQLAIHHDLYQKGLAKVSDADADAGQSNLAWSLLNQGKAAEALPHFAALPESPDALRGRAAALARLGRHAEAVGVLERARQLAPEDHRIDLLLAAERSAAAEAK